MSKFHPEAVKAYNTKAWAVAEALQPMPPRPGRAPVASEKSDAPVMAQFGRDQVRPDSWREFRVDHTGARVACYFYVEGRGLVGAADAAHGTLVDISKRIAADTAYRNALSDEFVYSRIIDWLQSAARRGRDFQPLIDFVETAALEAIQRFDIWIPIPVISIPHPIQIGAVTFRRITKPMMNEYAQKTKAYDTAAGGAVFDRLRSRIQAATAACLSVEAEPTRAEQIVAEETEAAIAVLRLACPILLDVYQWAPVDPSFIDGFGGSFFLRVIDSKIAGHHVSLPERMASQWVITPEDAQHNFRLIWGFGHNLIVIQRNEFQELLLSALIHYSKSVLKPDTSERLVYVVTALEALFVREGEPIVQNLRERMAVLQGPALDERLKAVETITKIYDLRSKFVHRAVPVADMSVLADFIAEAWTAMFFILNNYNKWATKGDFLHYVDSYKFRGPEFDTRELPPLPTR